MQSILKKIKILIMDVDGVLTDGTFAIDDNGIESKTFNTLDGAGIKYLHRAGIKTAIITGRYSKAVTIRAEELGISIIYQKALDKIKFYDKILSDYKLKNEDVAYIGDDLTDIPILKTCGFSAAPANARPEVKKEVKYLAKANGGEGVVRELSELIIKAQGKWENILKRYV